MLLPDSSLRASRLDDETVWRGKESARRSKIPTPYCRNLNYPKELRLWKASK